MAKIKVMVVDDSAIVRDLLLRELSRQPDMEVVATAPDPYIARDKLAHLAVDVLILDIEMPRMDGLTFLRHLMKSFPKPVIILSSLLADGNTASLTALELGAVAIVPKPGGPFSVVDVISGLLGHIRTAALLDFRKLKRQVEEESSRRQGSKSKRPMLSTIETSNKLICIGASTGGTVALEHLFRAYDKIMPPTIAVIHMPERFTEAFAIRLNGICNPNIKEAEDGEEALPGHVYIAPGNYHLTIKLTGSRYRMKLHATPRLHGQRPAVDPLFESAAAEVGRNAIGVLLTGMGRDGAIGLLKMREQGGRTICQDEETSVVFGMPKAGIDVGAAQDILGLDKIYGRLVALC